MRKIDWFERSTQGKGWLHRLGLKANELVEVEGRVYRYGTERDGQEHVLTPVDGPITDGGRRLAAKRS
jgi:hypothetical protein